LLWAVFGVLVFAVWRRTGHRATLALIAVAALPLTSFLAGLLRQLPFDNALVAAGSNPLVRYGVPCLTGTAIILALVRWPHTFERWLRRGLLAISFASVVVIVGLGRAASQDPAVVKVHRKPPGVAHSAACPSIVALLFDELSFAYLYQGSEVRHEYPALRRLSAAATNYMAVRAPGDETLVALPGYLAGRPAPKVRVAEAGLMELGEDGKLTPFSAAEATSLFATARRLGYRTEMAGYYLPYCSLLGRLVDECRSLSFYNASGVREGFSPLNPIETTFIMWPWQFPFGIVKNPPFARLQRGLVGELTAFARRPLDELQPVFRFVHFSVPHLPFVFDEDGYDPPLDPLRTSPDDGYQRQLRYVDRLVGEMTAAMERDGSFHRSTFIVFADHGFRFGGRERDKLHIPFIVKMAGQTVRSDVAEPQRGEVLLTQLVGSACDNR
ncbi:MAG TPA: sulfatase-like hydrolase/transferase, partial [Vicinamibacterales bacterium]